MMPPSSTPTAAFPTTYIPFRDSVQALAYRLAEIMAPGSFIFSGTPAAQNHMTGFTTFYFSFITLTTVGYGDIAPATNITRMLASAEAITGTLFVAVFIARLVALYLPNLAI